jgi:prepilin-type N-terminal cleavage/methylation domain-containing protein
MAKRFDGNRAAERGFSLPELMIAVAILLMISSVVTSGVMQLTSSQRTISNRTQLHAGVRSTTELLQQEVGQAGRVSFPGTAVALGGNVAVGAQTVTINQTIGGVTAASVSGIFVGEWLTVDAGSNAETVAVTAVSSLNNTITATFTKTHAAGQPVNVYGGFATGIVPPQYYDGTNWIDYPDGSTGSVLKLYGDINGDGNMVYVEYTCDTEAGNLYRNVMPFDTAAAAKPELDSSLILLGNVTENPDGTPCFTYMPDPLYYLSSMTDSGCNCPQSFVLDVAITLSVNTQQIDPITRQFQTETKALLNVSPRNVYHVWQLANDAVPQTSNRAQPMPPSVKLLLP